MSLNAGFTITDAKLDTPLLKREYKRRGKNMLRHYAAYTRKVARHSIRRVGQARKEPQRFVRRQQRGEGFLTINPAWIRWSREVRRQPASPAGTPPYTHGAVQRSGSPSLRESLIYRYDPSIQGYLIGSYIGRAGDEFFAIHEHGGVRRMVLYQFKSKINVKGAPVFRELVGSRRQRRMESSKAYERIGYQVLRYPPRPFVKPAALKASHKLDEFWAKAVA